ncbi:MAG: hypothetical protein ACFFAT_14965, partial [Promethearchaeota archaeon]
MTNIFVSWLNGISALLLVSAAWYFVIVCLYYFRTLENNKTYLGGMLLFTAIGLGWMGITLSFLSTEFAGSTLPWVIFLMPFFAYSTIPLGCFAIIYIVWELVGTKKSKKIIYGLYVILFIAYYILLYFNIESNVAIEIDANTGLGDDWIRFGVPFFYFIWILVIITAIITFIGFTKMRSHTTGELKTRSSLLLLATPLVALGILADTVVLGSLTIIPIFEFPNHLDFLYMIRLIMIL